MAIAINSSLGNSPSLSANNYLYNTMLTLSSGLKINSAKDDAAGLRISQNVLTKNAEPSLTTTTQQKGISFIPSSEVSNPPQNVGEPLLTRQDFLKNVDNTTSAVSSDIHSLAWENNASSNSAEVSVSVLQENTHDLNSFLSLVGVQDTADTGVF